MYNLTNSLDDGFPQMNTKAKLLMPIIEKYSFESVATALFAINSWRDNRSAQESCLALNAALIKCTCFGIQQIDTYYEFNIFFETIESILKITYMDDVVLNDFGEVKLCFNKSFYPVITGTGHTGSVYSVLQFLESLSSELKLNEQTLNLLLYSKSMITNLSSTNKDVDEDFPVVFEKPTDKYFYSVQNFIAAKSWESLEYNIINMLSGIEMPIVKSHFVKGGASVYPLFNPSLVLDYYTCLLGKSPAEVISKHVNQTLTNKFKMIFTSAKSYVNEMITDNYRVCADKKPTSIFAPGFLLVSGENALLFIDTSKMNSCEIDSYIRDVESFNINNQLGFIDLSRQVEPGKFKGINITSHQNFHFILYNDYTNLDETYMSLRSTEERMVYNAVDLMYLIMFSDSIDQIIEFIFCSSKESTQIFSLGGVADYFSFWKQEHGYISKGAIEYGTIYSECETSAAYVYDVFAQLTKCFPFHLENLPLGTPEEWIIILDDNGIYQFSKKSKEMIGGACFILSNGCTIFLSYDFMNILKDQKVQQIQQYRDFISGILERFIIENSKTIADIQSLKGMFLQFRCDSLTISLEASTYVKIINFHSLNNNVYFSYAVDSIKIMERLSSTLDRSVEYGFILQLLVPLSKETHTDLDMLIKEIKLNTSKKKTANAKITRFDYYYNMDTLHIRLTDTALLFTRKEIARIAVTNGISPGKYSGKDATAIVRKIQQALVSHFEKMVSIYERISLHVTLLMHYSSELFSDYVNLQGYDLTNEVDEIEKESSKQKLLNLRDNNKQMQATLLYLIETNLFLTADRGKIIIDNSDLENLIAYSHWLISLQSSSDLCFHTDSKTQFIVLEDYRIDVELGVVYSDKIDSKNRRTYESDFYSIKGGENDREFFEKVANGFYVDTGINLRVFESVMKQLMECSFPEESVEYSEICPNVIRINKSDAIRDYSKFVTETVETSMVQSVYDYLTIESEKLKVLAGKEHPILPIWDREHRDNRFSVKPLLSMGDSYIYSPITIKEIHDRWINGIMQFYLPFEIGFEQVLFELRTWKEYYEHQFAFDVRDVFRSKDFTYTEANVDIHRIDRIGNHPLIHELGDYDVIALDSTLKRIFIIECKVLQPIGSIFEHSMEQKRFFKVEKYDEKFQKRINYLQSVHKSFFKNIGYDLGTDEYSILPYMVVNKIFDSYYKKVSFPIVTLDELKQIIGK